MTAKKSDITAQVLNEHRIIRESLNTLNDEMCKEIKAEEFLEWRLEFIWKLRDFRNHMLKHFDFEELGGFMKEIIEDAPEIVDKVKKLEADHPRLKDELDDILDELQKMKEKEDEKLGNIKQRLKHLIISIKAHEVAENDLIQKVYSQEYGYPA